MFSVGQQVWHRRGQRSGVVVECDGERVYIRQDNGAELDFAAADLTATPPEAPATLATRRPTDGRDLAGPGVYGAHNRALTAADITPEHLRVLDIIPVRTMRAIGVQFERTPRSGRFNALDPATKLNAIVDITGVAYRTMREYSDRPGELSLLMGKGLADSRDAG